MKKLLLPLAVVASISAASAATFPTNTTPAWKSYMATGNTADIVSSPTVATAIGGKVDATSGQSLNQTLQTPTITGGTATSTDVSAAKNLATGASTSRTLAAQAADVTNVMDYGAVASVDVDNTPFIQAAIDAACAKVKATSGGQSYSEAGESAGDVFIPQGRYAVIGTINWTCPVHLHGAGRGATTLIWSGTGTSSLFNMLAPLTDSNRYWYYGAVHDLEVVNEGSQSGAVWRVQSCFECQIYNVGTNGAYRSVVVYAGFHSTIHNFSFLQAHEQTTNGVASGTEDFSTAFELYGSDNSGGTNCTATNNGNCLTRSDIVDIYSGQVTSALDGTKEPTDCLYIHDFMATVWIKNLACGQVRNGVNIRCDNSIAIGNCPQFIHLDRFEAETNNSVGTNNNYGITADNFAHLEAYSSQLYASQAGPNNIVLNNTRFHSGHFEWHGGKIQNSNGVCVISRIDGAQFLGGVITQCGQDGTSSDGWGIAFYEGTSSIAENSSVIGVQFCHDNVGGTTTDMRPVIMDATSNYNLVDGSMIQNCAGASSNNSTVSSNVNKIVNEVGP